MFAVACDGPVALAFDVSIPIDSGSCAFRQRIDRLGSRDVITAMRASLEEYLEVKQVWIETD